MGKWYEEWFDRSEYEIVYRHRDDEEARLLVHSVLQTIDTPKGSTVLDVGCGRGRHSILFAEAGFDVTGIDLSVKSIEDARIRASAADLAVTFEVGDMRKQYCDECFDVVVNLFTAFGYFDEDGEHLDALKAMAGALRPGGWFIQDFLNAPYVEKNLVAENVDQVNGLSVRQIRKIERGRINKTISLSSDIAEEKTFEESVRLLTRSDFELMYESAGLEMTRVLGTYAGEEYSHESPRLIMFARKVRD